MISTIKSMFGIGPKADFAKLVADGALIIDVRSKSEFQGGHIKQSLNIPLQSLEGQLQRVPKNRVIITCCASGMRSANAATMLKSHGYKEVYNGGGWQSLQNKI
jgi:rhodanese-related sulfurtransferase